MSPEELVRMVQAAQYRLTIPDPPPAERAAWRRTVYAARRSGVPGSGGLMYMGRDNGDMTIWTMGYGMSGAGPSPVSGGASPTLVSTSPAVIITPVEVPQRLSAAPHPAVVMARKDPGLAGVRKALLPRVLRILQAIADEAERRGYQMVAETGHGSPGLCVRASGFRYSLTFREERGRPVQVGSAGTPSRSGIRQRQPVLVPTGRLQLSLNNDRRWWSDRKRWKLEDKLGEVFAKLEQEIASDTARRAEQERRQAERCQQWEQAMALARDRFAEARRREQFMAQLDAWQRATVIRQFCVALETATAACDDTGQRHAARRWTAWATNYADLVDPVQTLENLTDCDFDPEPDPEDLRSQLDGWSPHGPDVGYRW